MSSAYQLRDVNRCEVIERNCRVVIKIARSGAIRGPFDTRGEGREEICSSSDDCNNGDPLFRVVAVASERWRGERRWDRGQACDLLGRAAGCVFHRRSVAPFLQRYDRDQAASRTRPPPSPSKSTCSLGLSLLHVSSPRFLSPSFVSGPSQFHSLEPLFLVSLFPTPRTVGRPAFNTVAASNHFNPSLPRVTVFNSCLTHIP